MNDIKLADVVVIGRIVDYQIVLDPKARENNRKSVEGIKNSKTSEPLSNVRRFISDYAKFDVLVEEVVKGTATERMTATWDNSTFGEPESIPPGPYLIAFRYAQSAAPPLGGPSAIIMPTPIPEVPTVLQALCARAFIFKSDSTEAIEARGLLRDATK